MKPKELLDLNFAPNILFYGPAGTGKTGLIAQAKNPYIFDFDDGMRTAATLKDKFFNLRQLPGDGTFDIYREPNPANPVMWMKALLKMQELVDQSASGNLKYKTVVVDSLTGCAKSIYLYVMKLSGDSMRVPQIQHWGLMVTEIERMLTLMRSLKCLKLLTAHEMVIETSDGDRFTPMSMTKGHSLNKLTWLFDEVIYTKVKEAGMGIINYIVSGKSTNIVRCRTRSGFNKDVVHNEIGLEGILEKFQYKYEK